MRPNKIFNAKLKERETVSSNVEIKLQPSSPNNKLPKIMELRAKIQVQTLISWLLTKNFRKEISRSGMFIFCEMDRISQIKFNSRSH